MTQEWQLSFDNKNPGHAWVLGSDVSTDAIISGKYLEIRDFPSLSKHVFESVVDDFPSKVQPGDVIIAGDNFGAGSSREQAPTMLKYLGIGAIFAKSFARIFYRNAINIGLPAFTITQEILEAFNTGDEINYTIDLALIENVTSDQQFQLQQFPPFFMNILRHGGAISLLKEELGA
jgi:3-isopropylmalate/(R)-2-methylmalate dehydratase small subunit